MQTWTPAEGSATPISLRPAPQADDIREQLERVISSPEFPGVGRAAAFLRYVVSETLEDRGNRIKAYSIAIEVFGRDAGFTQDDPVVRIEAGRLRRSLERYYLVAGQHDPVRIDIPKGGYIPTFTWSCPASVDTGDEEAGETSPSEVSSRRWWRARRVLLPGAAALAAVAISLYWIGTRSPAPSLERVASLSPDRPALVVAPFTNLGEGPEAQLYTAGLTEELMTILPRFKEIKVFGRETSKSLPADVGASEIRTEFGARYLLAGGVRISGKRLRVTARLLDTSDGEILWSQNYDNDLASEDLFAIQTDVARKVATAIAQPYGVMAQVDSASPPPDDLGAYECTLRFYAYRSELSPEAHARVRDCLEAALARFPNYATAWAMLSIVYLDEDRYKFNPTPGQDAAIQRALDAARRATQIDPNNTRGLQALMTALFFDRQLAESLRVGEQALATNPNDTELMGEFGTRLAIAGQWQRGADLLDQAIALNPGSGGFYHGTRALAAYMLRDNHTAVLEIRQANMQKFPLFHVVAAIIYAEAGMMDDARREGQVFVSMRPDFLPNLVTELAMRNMQPEDRDRLIEGLRKAGMTVRDPDAIASTAATSDLQPR
ncbi:adenylate cyclase [Rhizobium leguminosarum]|jgi:adenylate cyclase|uniref:Adenylate cyclase n=2 Tax=Rhizobium TaxID=379 RepID=A0A444I2T6_RHILE|nr:MULTISPECIES: adenylate cyclase [Rhizobium]MBY5457645.1 adenylate cyclase [Rhizobium leguminosarum]NKL67282.1 adenylate cyclase [Rhizobium leguminosarum bv. viciae]RWX15138.1 adenylate cyclase [Rhizobium leguminosarum]RWX31551.1 adenylate cyclase [Rhizobium leguminosarum]TAU53517.1 adenylate cyclase [Rhizobium leguminosarum]